jgi:peptidoglycan hydrolase-like protein with peptidoglycan-binding domain
MSRSPLAVWVGTKSYRASVTPKQGICLHHQAGTAEDLKGTFDSRNVSTQYSVGKTGTIRQYVEEEHVSFATGTKLGNENFINIECANTGGSPTWPVSDDTIKAVIDLCADIAARNGFYPLVAGVNLRQHKSFVATYCAGRVGDRLEENAQRSNAIIESGGIPAAQIPSPAGAASYPLVRRGSTGDYVKIVQRAVGVKDDGIFGPATETAVKTYQKAHALVADGIVGPASWTVILGSATAKEPAKEVVAHKTLPVLRVGSYGEDVRVVQRIVGVTADGIFGNLTSAAVKAYQKAHGLVADGIVGEKTWAAMGL